MPPSSTQPVAPAAFRWARTAVKVAFALIVGAWSLLLIAWLTLHWGILPQAPQWRPQIEQRASAALGIPVHIGRIEVRSRGWIPSVELTDVVLSDAAGREALRLPRVTAAVSARSLLTLQLRFEQLLVEGPALDVRRDAAGRLHVAGLEVGGGGAPSDALDWFFKQHEFVIRRGAVRWTDEQRGAPPLQLTEVDVVVRNGLRRHELRIDATPPAAWGERFSLRGRFTQPLLGRAGDWRRWSGTLHADLPRASARELNRHVNLPFELDGGEGALRAWVDVKNGEPRAATVDLALADLTLRLAPELEPLAFSQVEGRVSATRHAHGFALAAQRFGFTTADGLAWPRGALSLVLQRKAEGAAHDGGDFNAERLDLALMAQVAHRLPLGAPLRKALAELAPQGVVQGLDARWDGPLEAPERYRVKARASGLSVAAAPPTEPGGFGRPGWRNATVELTANEKGGDARLVLDGGALEFPGVFDDPLLPFDRFAAQLAWRIDARARNAGGAPAIELRVPSARFANADAQGELSAVWRTGPAAGHGSGKRFPGTIDIAGKLVEGRAAATARYLPTPIPAGTRDYVRQAITGGRIVQADFKAHGDLWDFPFHQARHKNSVFRVAARVEGVDFAYVPPEAPGQAPPWPAFSQVAGELQFDRGAMEIRNTRARVFGVELVRVNAAIRDLVERPVLVVDGQARGPAADLLRFVGASPIAEWSDHALARAGASGAAELKLALQMPLDHVERSTVKGSVQLAGNDLRLAPEAPLLANTRARVDFTHKGFAIVGGNARVLGGEAQFEGGSAGEDTVRFSASGTASAEALRRAPELGSLARLAASAGGQTAWRLHAGVVRGRPEFSLTSSLQGLALDLPAPLRKAAGDTMPLRVSLQPLADGTQDQLRVDLGNVLHAQYLREIGPGGAARVVRGGIGVGEPAPMPAAGVQALVNVARFDADAWEAAAGRLAASAPASAGAGSAGPAVDDAWLPQIVGFRAAELVTGGRTLNRVVAGLTRDAARWRASVDADQLGGYLEWHPGSAGQPGTVYARLARLALPESQAQSVESLLDQAPTSAPSLDIVVDDFDLRGKKLGRVEIEASNTSGGQWRLDKLNLAVPEARLTATGQWAPKKRMVMDFKLDVADGGAFLERLGFGRVVRGGKGRLAGQLSWAGSPLSPHVPSLGGQVNLALDSGQFLKAGAGAARLLSVLSLQSLPRRLSLDFRDVFQEGFPFDNASGDLSLREGVAHTNNLRMRGAQAAVLMEGQADLERETQDLRVIVVPEINAGTASLAYAAINPALGLTTFLAQMVLRKPLMAAGTREFHVTGDWDDPKVERVQRKLTEPLPDLDPPAAAGPPASSPTLR